MESNNSSARDSDSGPSAAPKIESETGAIESSDAHKTAKYEQEKRCNRRRLAIHGTLFIIMCISCVVSSQLIPVKGDMDFFDPACVDGVDDPAEQNFHIDLTYGSFTFTQAKLIDITWDTIVGQGGRLIHGWVLYRTVIRPLLVFAMETSSVTYKYYTTLSFSQTSLETLWILLSSLFSTRSYSVLICSILTVYAIGYTIFFPVIFSAATGYINQAHKLYAMPQGDVIQLDNEHLSLCWVIDPLRLGLPNDSGVHVEIGPNFSSIGPVTQLYKYTNTQLCFITPQEEWLPSKTDDLEYTPGGWKTSTDSSIWDHLGDYDGRDTGLNISRNFANIRAYALTAQLLQISLHPVEWLNNGPRATLQSMQLTDANLKKVDWLPWNTSDCTDTSKSLNSLFPSLEALEYRGPTQSGADPSIEDKAKFPPFNERNFEQTQWSYLYLNESISLGPGVLPYNSTIWLNDTSIPLPAPFLDVGYNCSGNTALTKLGNCVCYKGEPIPANLLSSEKAICNTAPGYVWGFSSYLIRLGLILEAFWMAFCFICYLRLSLRSNLIGKEPIRTAGNMRLAIDLSESARDDLGQEENYLSETVLSKRLNNFKISYQTSRSQNDEMTYRIISGKKSLGFEGRLVEKLARWDNVFDPINMRVDPVSDVMNIKFKRITTRVKEKLGGSKRTPTDFEVYEDLNWRI